MAKKTVNISEENHGKLSKLVENATEKSSIDMELGKLLESVSEDSFLVVLKKEATTTKIKEALGIFDTVFKQQFTDDDAFIDALADFFITNYKDYEPVEEKG